MKDRLTNYGQIDHWGRDGLDHTVPEDEDDFIEHCFVDGGEETQFKVNLISDPIEDLDKFTPKDTLQVNPRISSQNNPLYIEHEIANDDEDIIQRHFKNGPGMESDADIDRLRVGSKEEEDYRFESKKSNHAERPFSPPFSQI